MRGIFSCTPLAPAIRYRRTEGGAQKPMLILIFRSWLEHVGDLRLHRSTPNVRVVQLQIALLCEYNVIGFFCFANSHPGRMNRYNFGLDHRDFGPTPASTPTAARDATKLWRARISEQDAAR